MSASGFAREIIADTGLDVTMFLTAGHLVSWTGLAPVLRQRKPSKGQGDVYQKTYCAQAADGTGTPAPSSASACAG